MSAQAIRTLDDNAAKTHRLTYDLNSKIAAYYDIATPGYQDWSANINMHFGLYRAGDPLYDREAMVENTNKEVLDRLGQGSREGYLLDLGCGIGATARYAVENRYAAKVCGISLCGSQVEQAIDQSAAKGLASRTHFARMDFHHTPLPNACFDGAYAIESSCHSPDHDKRAMLKEAYRLLKPGSKLVLCDAFIKAPNTMNVFSRWANRKTCENWALGCFGDIDKVRDCLEELGFVSIQIENVSARILPSALFVPWVSFKYFCKLLMRLETDARYWRHLFAPLWALLLALNLKHFGYFLVSAEKA